MKRLILEKLALGSIIHVVPRDEKIKPFTVKFDSDFIAYAMAEELGYDAYGVVIDADFMKDNKWKRIIGKDANAKYMTVRHHDMIVYAVVAMLEDGGSVIKLNIVDLAGGGSVVRFNRRNMCVHEYQAALRLAGLHECADNVLCALDRLF